MEELRNRYRHRNANDKMKPSGFDSIASIYDGLARLVYGNAIQQAQKYFLDDIPSKSKVLILGGGTGWLLEYLLLLKPACEVWYVEASAKMIALSQAKTDFPKGVHFIQGTEDHIPSSIQFDVVITNFYLDLFTPNSLDVVIGKIQNTIKPDSLWLVADFVEGNKWWQSVLLSIMYRFFRITCAVEATQLPDWNQSLAARNLAKSKSRFFYNGFIEAAQYKTVERTSYQKK